MAMKANDSFRLLLVSIITPFYLLFLWLAFRPLVGEIFFRQMNEKGLLSAASFDNKNATYRYILGRFYHYGSDATNINRAIDYYRSSLRLSPLQGGCWLDLAKAYQIAGLTKNAETALERASVLNPNNPEIMWEAGIFFLIEGNVEKAVKVLKKFILLRSERQEDIYDIFWKLQLEPHYILKNLVPDSCPYYKRYLIYLISTGRIAESKELWERLENLPMEDELFLRYTDFLISKHLYDEAEKSWEIFVDKKFKKKKEDKPNLLWNGGFEHDIQNSGFDWRIGGAKGVQVFLDRDVRISGDRSLGVTFDGTENPDITIASQVVRVVPEAKYSLRGYIKANSLTTTNGLFLSVDGHDCKGFSKRSEVVAGTNFWKELSIEFEAPPGCNAISVNIRREKSQKLNNKISGIAWIDEINLTQR
jgi:hypothetical protein